MTKSRPSWLLFGGVFASSFLLFGGVLLLILLYLPAITQMFHRDVAYQPQLPLAQDRDARDFYDPATERLLAKQLYPPIIAVAEAAPVEPGNWIRIPAIGVNVPLVRSPSQEDVDVLATLDSGAALYPNGIRPGSLGTTFVSAHSTGEPWKGQYRFAFLRINELTANNLIHIDWQGTRYTYRITGKDIVTPDPNFTITSQHPVPTLKLMACWPLWSTSQRMLINAELANVTQLTPPPS